MQCKAFSVFYVYYVPCRFGTFKMTLQVVFFSYSTVAHVCVFLCVFTIVLKQCVSRRITKKCSVNCVSSMWSFKCVRNEKTKCLRAYMIFRLELFSEKDKFFQKVSFFFWTDLYYILVLCFNWTEVSVVAAEFRCDLTPATPPCYNGGTCQ